MTIERALVIVILATLALFVVYVVARAVGVVS
jgi:hypothetical protein